MYTHGKARGALASLATLALLAVCLMLGAVSVSAQETTGSLRGTVTDVNGAVVSGATVTLTNDATGAQQTKQTSGDGIFEFSKLAPGSYTVTIEASGFKRALNKEVSVKLGIVNSLDTKLEPGAVSETVTVTAGTEEIVQRDQSQISHTVETRKIADLPSNGAGAGLDTLALLAPGVIPNNSGGVNTNGTGISVNGNRARSNNFQIDGSDNNDLSVAGPALFVDAQDSLQEYQVITNNFSAQYGRNQGAIINLVTKSGTNDFHGTLFEYHRDRRALDTLDNFERAGGQTEPLPSLYNVFGGQVGGPMYLPKFGEGGKSYWKGTNKAFFHFDYQGIRNPASATLRSTSLAFLSSEFPRLQSTFPGNSVFQSISQFSAFAIPGTTPRTDLTGAHTVFINPTLPAASRISTTQRPGDQGPFQIGGPFDVINLNGTLFQAANPQRIVSEPFTENYWDFRFDLKPNSRDSITVRNLHQTQLFVNTLATSNGYSGDLPAGSKNFGGSWTHSLSPSIVNEARANWQKINVEFGGGCDARTPGCVPAPLQIGSALANIGFGGVLGFTNTSQALQTMGPATNLPQGRVGKVYQFADNLTWAKGKHSMIMGAEYKHLNEVVPFLPNFNGAYAYSSVTRLLNNAPSGISLTAGDPTLAFTEDDQYYFFQDDFKIRPNFTLNLGVRYEYTGQPINKLHDVTVARESGPSPFYASALPLSIKTVPKVPADKNNFAPRFGFAWSPHFEKGFLHSLFGTDATVFRGGYSFAYDAAFYNILLNVQNGAPFSAALALNTGNALTSTTTSPLPLPGNPFGDIIRSNASTSGVLPLGKLDPRYLSQTTVAPDFHSPYSEQWSFGIQHQFGRNQVAEARYVGTRGIGLFQNVNDNFFVGPMYNGITNWFGTGINLPSFKQFLPPGVVPQVCVDNPATPFVNESTCNGRIKPQSSITMRANTANSWYHGLQTRYNARLFKDSLSLGASYTWSKTIDDASEIFAFDIASANAQNPFCINSCEHALSQIDRRHAFSTNFIWEMPWMKQQKGFVGHMLGGWQLNGVFLAVSGEPYTPGQFFNGSVLGVGNAYLTSGDRPFIGNPNADKRLVGISQIDAFLIFDAPLTNPKGFYSFNEINLNGNFVPVTPSQVRYIVNLPGAASVFGTPFGDSPRNSLLGPMLNQLNLGLFKHIRISERWNLELRAEAYNFLNHPNPGYGINGAGYLPDFFVEDAGVPGSSFAQNSDIEKARRVLQFGLRLSF
jgi:outer membrane receptor protein involved in Fe transport